jgi:hypothetical protein
VLSIAAFLRAQAHWRLDCAGAAPVPAARCAVALLDAAVYVAGLPDDDPDLTALTAGGDFRGGMFYPGDAGLTIARRWQLSEGPPAGPRALLAALAAAAGSPPARAPGLPRAAHPVVPAPRAARRQPR